MLLKGDSIATPLNSYATNIKNFPKATNFQTHLTVELLTPNTKFTKLSPNTNPNITHSTNILLHTNLNLLTSLIAFSRRLLFSRRWLFSSPNLSSSAGVPLPLLPSVSPLPSSSPSLYRLLPTSFLTNRFFKLW